MSDKNTLDLYAIGQRITELREKKSVTQEKLSEMIGVSRQAVSQWENGAKELSLSNAVALCDVLGCDLLYLINGDDSDGYMSREKEIAGKVTSLSPDALENLINFSTIDGFLELNYDIEGSKGVRKIAFPRYEKQSKELLNLLLENYKSSFSLIIANMGRVIDSYTEYLHYSELNVEDAAEEKTKQDTDRHEKQVDSISYDEINQGNIAMLIGLAKNAEHNYHSRLFQFTRDISDRIEMIGSSEYKKRLAPHAQTGFTVRIDRE